MCRAWWLTGLPVPQRCAQWLVAGVLLIVGVALDHPVPCEHGLFAVSVVLLCLESSGVGTELAQIVLAGLDCCSDHCEAGVRPYLVLRFRRQAFPFRHGDGALALKHGEIIVGKHLLPGVVTASQPTYDRLYERLKKAFQRGTPVRLTVRG